ncbi:MAG: methyltransferase [Rhodospirillales bacterium RIFCSPLOWO2_12_FULL_58_28]|nr:MAG: methyltransferase [Rhodospirillales bacterium RIFCSPLOWO2_02_FULL_58_16]OHC77804.1 MAG: methyltransferase [Rhodospirillales bacterium RIFCSPLOWO2_12_FULL_58_28]
MTKLADLLRRRIADEGPLTVAQYMNDALYHPDYGYYTGRDPLGVAGDFITAPEISQMFGELIGVWCAMAWKSMGAPDAINLVELGPGRGSLMYDLLRVSGVAPGFGKALHVHMVEISPALRARQREALENAVPDNAPTWLDDFSQTPQGPLLLIANEFFDALPVHQFQRSDNTWRQRLVDIDRQGNFRFILSAPIRKGPVTLPGLPPGLPVFPNGLPDAPEGAVIEVCPSGIAVAHAVAERVTGHGGAALVIDYGHAVSSFGETVQALKRHAYHDVLVAPGDADITAHVDFSALAFAAAKAGARLYGPVRQGDFLESLGISARAEALSAAATPRQAEDIRLAHKRLTDEDEMGALFKVMAVTGPDLPAPPGFA